ncbi:MAG: aldo/keto reductase [Thermoanaerobaculia bacterium]|nr:aldo/keto reductase [Thermoanaerobaculia bacterium]
MGSWITFNVPPIDRLRSSRVDVLRAFFEKGGAVIDSSPMYGYSEEVIGYCLERLENDDSLFSATKVWTPTAWLGRKQIRESHELWGVDRFSLLQVHNLVDWESHLPTLQEMKSEGAIRYIGMTTSHGRRHRKLERLMREQPAFDFVQLTYNVRDREAERRLLPLAADRGLGVLVNRPFRRGALIDELEPHPLPSWASAIDCATWPQFLLKFIVSHPAVTCAIPATSRVDHMLENMEALRGRLPDPKMRRRMVQYVGSL